MLTALTETQRARSKSLVAMSPTSKESSLVVGRLEEGRTFAEPSQTQIIRRCAYITAIRGAEGGSSTTHSTLVRIHDHHCIRAYGG